MLVCEVLCTLQNGRVSACHELWRISQKYVSGRYVLPKRNSASLSYSAVGSPRMDGRVEFDYRGKHGYIISLGIKL